MSDRPVKVGLIGLGEVAQVTHIPVLAHLSELYEVTAICDVSATLVQAIGDRLHLPADRRFTDAEALAGSDDVDVVFVLSSDEYHADQAIAALRQGKHVFIEKPISLNEHDAVAIARARDESGKQVMVGYMRRFAPAFEEMKRRLPEVGEIAYVRVRDIIGPNRLIIDQVENVLRPSDVPESAIRDRQRRAEMQVRAAIGEVSSELVRAYRLLCGLGSHDLSAMRELIGTPDRVVAAETWQGGSWLSAIFARGDFRVVFEMGVDKQSYFDAHIAVYGASLSMTVQYDTPYIRHLPTTLRIRRTDGVILSEETVRPTYSDPYSQELRHLHAVITSGADPKTTIEDSMEDLKLFRQIIECARS